MGDPFFQSDDQGHKRKRVRRPNTSATTRNAPDSKTRTSGPPHKSSGKRKQVLEDDVAESEGSDDDVIAAPDEDGDVSESGDENETPAQKRLRLAQAYLDGLKQSQMREDGTFDAGEIDQEIIASRLQQDVLESSGKLHTVLGGQLVAKFKSSVGSSCPYSLFKTGKNHHRLPITCVKMSKDGSRLYVADKQGQIIQYSCEDIWNSSQTTSGSESLGLNAGSGVLKKSLVMRNHIPPKASDLEKFNKKQQSQKHKTLSTAQVGEQKGHIGEVVTIDITDDGKLLASGGKDKLLGVWDLTNTESTEWKAGIRGHKDVISSIAFRSGTSTLYTSSFDRMIKVFNLDSLTYSETLFGHQDKIHSISTLRNEVLVSAGSRDRTCRYWKIVDESQLVFRGGGNSKLRDLIDGAGLDHEEEEDQIDGARLKKKKATTETNFLEGSIDCVCMVDDTMFLSGGDSGSISLWATNKKKAIFTLPLAHGTESTTVTGTSDEIIIKPRWITSLYCLPYSDIFCSGSWDGVVRIWRLMKGERGNEIRKFEVVGQVEVGAGIVNSLHMLMKHIDIDDTTGTASSISATGAKRQGTHRSQKVVIASGLGQEHRLGRWTKLKVAKNQCVVIVLEL